MQTKSVLLKNGERCTLYLNEKTGKYTLDEQEAKESVSNFQRFFIDTEIMSRHVCTYNQRSSILEYYNETSLYNQEKIRTMINEDMNKIKLVYDIILDRQIIKERNLQYNEEI
jgi:hypothetical protein